MFCQIFPNRKSFKIFLVRGRVRVGCYFKLNYQLHRTLTRVQTVHK